MYVLVCTHGAGVHILPVGSGNKFGPGHVSLGCWIPFRKLKLRDKKNNNSKSKQQQPTTNTNTTATTDSNESRFSSCIFCLDLSRRLIEEAVLSAANITAPVLLTREDALVKLLPKLDRVEARTFIAVAKRAVGGFMLISAPHAP